MKLLTKTRGQSGGSWSSGLRQKTTYDFNTFLRSSFGFCAFINSIPAARTNIFFNCGLQICRGA
jgi:hypothetical protein